MMIDHHSPTISIHFQKFLHTSHDSNFPHRYGYLSESPNSKDSSVTWVSRIFFTLSWGPRRGFRSKMMMIRGWFLDGWNGWLEWNILDDGPRWCLAPHAYWCHISWGNSEDWNPMGYIYIYVYIWDISRNPQSWGLKNGEKMMATHIYWGDTQKFRGISWNCLRYVAV